MKPILLPLEILFAAYFIAANANFIVAIYAFNNRHYAISGAMIGLFGGALAGTLFYFNLAFTPLIRDVELARSWSRWAFLIIGLSIFQVAIAAYKIAKRDGDG